MGAAIMAGSTLVSIALVGLAVMCVGLIAVALIVVFRTAGEHSIEFLMMLARGGKEEADEDSRHFATRRPDLRSIAKSQDFDSALAKHVVQDEIEPRTTPVKRTSETASVFTTTPNVVEPPSAFTTTPNAPFPDAVPRLGSRSSNGRVHHNGSHAEDDDEFSDLLDEQ
jgi:hypothetical protein